MYLMNHNIFQSQPNNNLAPQDTQGTLLAEDKLYRNDGIPPEKLILFLKTYLLKQASMILVMDLD